MITADLLERFKLTLDDLIGAVKRSVDARRRLTAAPRAVWLKDDVKAFLDSEIGVTPDAMRVRVAEMEAIAGVLENLRLGQTYASLPQERELPAKAPASAAAPSPPRCAAGGPT